MFRTDTIKSTLRKKTLSHQNKLRKTQNLKNSKKISDSQIEEKYIENLHKQIHFMNLEINLLKEKQKSQKGFFGLQNLMGGKMESPTNHIIEAKSKFNNLYKNLKTRKISKEDEILKKKENIVNLLSQNNELRVYNKKINEEYNNMDMLNLEKFKKKIKILEKSKNEIIKKEKRLDDQYEFTERENKKLVKFEKEENLKEEIRLEILEEEKNRLNLLITEFEKKIELLKKQKEEYLDLINTDPEIIKFRERNLEIFEILLKKEKIKNELDYEILELQNLQKLSLIKKTEQKEDRVNLLDELDRLTTILDDEKKINKMKIKRKIENSENEIIIKKETNLRIEENELEEVKRKFNEIHTIFIRFKIEVNNLQNFSDEILKKNLEKKKKIEILKKDFLIIEPEIRNLRFSVEEKIDEENFLFKKKQKLNKEVLDLKLEFSGLDSRIQFLKENFNFEEILKNINIEELRKVINTNKNVNNTINNLIGNWDNMKNFSK